MKKTLFAIVFTLILCVCVCAAPSAVQIADTAESTNYSQEAQLSAEGTCGDLSWSIDSDGNFTLSGYAGMPRTSTEDEIPWHDYKDSIKNVVIENAMYLAPYSFSGCTNLETVTFPDSLSAIDEKAFAGCTNLQALYIGDDISYLESIGDYAFENCSSLSEIYYQATEDKWKDISIGKTGNEALSACEVYYVWHMGECGENVTYIFDYNGNLTFRGTGEMGNFKSLLSSSSNMDTAQAAIRNIIIEDGITSIYQNAFTMLKNVETLTFTSSVKKIGGNLFSSQSFSDIYYYGSHDDLYLNTEIDGTNNGWYNNGSVRMHMITSGTYGDNLSWSISEDDTLTISGTGEMDTTNGMAPWADYRSVQIKKVIIEDGVTNIRDYAFSVFPYIESVVIGSGVKTIDEGAFTECTSLKEIEIPDSVETIGDNAFDDCSALKNVTFGSGIKSIGEEAFRNCTSLTEAILPDSLESIGYWEAFKGCTSLTKVSTGNSLTSISWYTFDGCTSLAEVKIGSGVETIDKWAFRGAAIKQLVIPDNVKVINYGAFIDCSKLETLVLGKGVTSIASQVFSSKVLKDVYYHGTQEDFEKISIASENDSLTKNATIHYVTDVGECGENLTWVIDENGTLTIFGSGEMTTYSYFRDVPWYTYASSIKNVVVCEGVTSITQVAFYSYSNLETVTLPDSLKKIEQRAFSGTDLKEITLPKGVEELGDLVFDSCTALEAINVDEDNILYSSVDGVLFDKNKKTLIQYPRNKTAAAYTVPDSVETIRYSAFNEAGFIKEITITNTVKKIDTSAFAACTALTDVYYYGSKADFENIKITNYGNNNFTAAARHYGVSIDLGEKSSADNNYYIQTKGVETLFDSSDNIYREFITESKLIKVTEKASADAETDVSSRYFFIDGETFAYTELTSLKSFTDNYGTKDLRLPSAKSEDLPGIRFFTTINPFVKLESEKYEITEYGYIVSLEDSLTSADEELTFDMSGKYVTGVAYNKAEEINKVFDSSGDLNHIISGVFYGVPEAAYTKSIVARSYTKIKINGADYTVYGENTAFSVYGVAKELENVDMSSEAKEIINSIIKTVEGNDVFLDYGDLEKK